MQKGSLELMKKINQKTILKIIHDEEAISRAEIAEIVGLSSSTVTNIVNELLDINLIKESEKGESRGGRKPILLELNPTGFYVIGFEWGIAEIKSVLMNFNKEIIAARKIAVTSNSYNFFLEQTGDVINSFTEVIDNPDKIFGVGLGIHGLVNAGEGVSLYAPFFGWRNLPIKEDLGKRMDYPFLIDNDANMMAYAEKWEGKDNFIFIFVGYGVGSAIVLNGQLYYGKDGSGSEIGHMSIVEDGPLCICGNHGCLNSLISLTELIREYNRELKSGLSYSTVEKEWNLLVAAARQGEKKPREILLRAGRHLGTAIANTINLLNTPLIIIGGAFIQARDIFMPVVEQRVQEAGLKTLLNDVKITTTHFKEDIGAVGAATRVFEEIFKLN